MLINFLIKIVKFVKFWTFQIAGFKGLKPKNLLLTALLLLACKLK